MSTDNPAPDPIDVEVGERVRAIRLARKVSQSALGRALGVSFQQVQKYERGANRISASSLCYIAGHLEVEVADLLPAANRASVPDLLPPALPVTPGLGDLTEIFERLSPERRSLLIAIAKQIARPERLA